jgi:predicted peptidase
VYVPPGWTPDRAWPVILFLHGAGERGTDGHAQLQIGVAAAIRANPERVPAIVVFPQAPAEERWLGATADAAMDALRIASGEFHGDPQRIYLTGISLGGFGTWHLALAHPRTFAALVPVCGGIVPHGTATSVQQSPLTVHADDPYRFTAESLRDVPVWMFHGAKDEVILPSESRRMHAALRAAGADVRYTEYEDVAHNAWTRAYAEEALWSWLFAQRIWSAAAMPPL